MELLKKTVLVLLLILMTVSLLNTVPVSALSGSVTLFTMDSGLVTKLTHNGSNVGTTDAWYTGSDGVDYPAYCIDPLKPGVGETGGSYAVTIVNGAITDPKVFGIVLAGYPYKTPAELGLPNAWEAAFATKFALKIYLENQLGHRNKFETTQVKHGVKNGAPTRPSGRQSKKGRLSQI